MENMEKVGRYSFKVDGYVMLDLLNLYFAAVEAKNKHGECLIRLSGENGREMVVELYRPKSE